MAVRLDEHMPECLVYLASDAGNVTYEIPYGTDEQQTGSAYAPESFAGKSHRVTVRGLSKKEIKGYRNLALNPCDVRASANRRRRRPSRTPPPTAFRGACLISRREMRLTESHKMDITVFGLTSLGDRNCATTFGGSSTLAGLSSWIRFA